MGRQRQWIMARKNGIQMHLTYDEGKSVVSERFIRTLKNKIHKYMTLISKKCLYWWIGWYS